MTASTSNQSVSATSRDEQRFRIGKPNSIGRNALLIGLDPIARTLAADLAIERPDSRRVLDLHSGSPDQSADMASWMSSLSAQTSAMADLLTGTNLVVLIASAGSDTHLAEVVGDLCRTRGLRTTAVLVDVDGCSDAVLARSLSQLRPLAAMLVVTDQVYVADMLRALRV